MAYTPSALSLASAARMLARGGVIACPTEAVWGLSCDPDNEAAVMRLLRLKRRAPEKGLILAAASVSQLGFLLADMDPQARERLASSWPGPYTWLVPHRGRVQPWVHGDHATVAVRVSDHPVLSALCAAFGGPLVSTSANPAGKQPPRQRFQVRRYFGDSLDMVMPGATGASARPSRIRDLASGELVRA